MNFAFKIQNLFNFKCLMLIIGISSMIFTACDEIDEPYIEEGATVWNGRKILIMDFTAHQCPNCPAAHEEIENLQDNFPNAIVPVAVHCGIDARPSTSDTTQPFHYDFTNDVSTELGGDGITSNGYFQVLEKPKAAINEFAPGNLLNIQAWRTEIAKFIQTYPEFSIYINKLYNESDSIISVDTRVETNIASDRNLHLCVYIVESHIIEWQKTMDDPDGIEDYEHNHVLRGSMNGSFGESINANNTAISTDDEFKLSYSIALGKDWAPQNLSIVAFVYDSDTFEVLQAEEIPLIGE
ncbi:MAG: Omp28-related outer membrane protein [Bacteroidales bacterium]